MAVIERARRSRIFMRLNGGTNPTSGGVITVSVSLGNVIANANGEKVMNVVGALIPVIRHTLQRVERIETTTLEL